MTPEDQILVDKLTEQLLLPLVAGGELRPLPPIGAKRARHLAAHSLVAGGNAAVELERARLTAARRLCAVDRVGEPTPGEWLLAFALNDLLQATNPDLEGWIGKERPERLLNMVGQVIKQAGAPRTIGDALGRHAAYFRVAELVRVDTRVSWWVGSADYHGAEPPARLLAWPRLRRVHEAKTNVELGEMPPAEAEWSKTWLGLLGRWLAASPLTDLATLDRPSPPFVWRGASLGLLQSDPGLTLAYRVVDWQEDKARAAAIARRAGQELERLEDRAVALEFADGIESRARALAQRDD